MIAGAPGVKHVFVRHGSSGVGQLHDVMNPAGVIKDAVQIAVLAEIRREAPSPWAKTPTLSPQGRGEGKPEA